MPSRPVPVTVVTGFLGAGKTTLVNRWLTADPSLAVIVNELGSVGIDGELLAARTRTLVEINGGCICCKTQEDLVRALDTLAASRPPRILVETSGGASPVGVLRAVNTGGRNGAYALDGAITVVDATRLATLTEHDLAIEQLGYADVVVLSRADLLDDAALAAARTAVARHNGVAHVVAAKRGDVSLPELLASRAGEPPAPPPVSTHRDYDSVSLVIEGEVDGDRFADLVEGELARCAGRLFRTKAVLAIPGMGDRMIVQGVADSLEISFGDPWNDAPRRSRLVVVGYGLDAEALEKAFRACAT